MKVVGPFKLVVENCGHNLARGVQFEFWLECGNVQRDSAERSSSGSCARAPVREMLLHEFLSCCFRLYQRFSFEIGK